MNCNNKVSQWIPKGYDYKEVKLRCGSTGITGKPLMCSECMKEINKGKAAMPGHCIHGTPLMDDTDHYDITCDQCEEEN